MTHINSDLGSNKLKFEKLVHTCALLAIARLVLPNIIFINNCNIILLQIHRQPVIFLKTSTFSHNFNSVMKIIILFSNAMFIVN